MTLLAHLAETGGHVEPGIGAAGDFVLVAPNGAGTQGTQTVKRALVKLAQRRGWLERETEGSRLGLSQAGLSALRRAASLSDRDAGKRQPAEARKAARAAPGGHPLHWLRQRTRKDGQPILSDAQLAASERLAGDFLRAQLMPRTTANWSAVAPARRQRRSAPGAGVEITDAALAARVRVDRALDAVGPEFAGLLVDVCCFEIGLREAERARGWPQRAGKVVLQLGLTALARHYGLLAPERPARSVLRHWGDEDYRPNLEAWR